ncbi:MAG: hypothetical protein IKK09_10350 [Clostridia bacterium]|nr:hypothetical protein [Clostridia bacterium]
MFGYVKIYKPELKVKHYEAYKGVYCSLCKTLKKEYGVFASLTLNYDFTLLALTRLAFAEECCGFTDSRCVYNPLKKCQQCVNGNEELKYSAAAAMIMCYYKVADDIADSSFFKGLAKRMLKPYFAIKRKKAKKKYPELDEIISRAMQKQSETEKRKETSVDIAADPSAKAMGEILCCGFEGEAKEKLNRFGYLVGRWVYLVDALDDMEDDRKNNSYNVFNNINKREKEARDYAVGAINLTAGQLVREFENLNPARFSEIMENIVYDGLHNSMKEILNKKEEEK